MAMPWLQQEGPRGWQKSDNIAERANVLCSALAVVRFALLASSKLAGGLASAEVIAGGPLSGEGFKECMGPLAAAVHSALQQLQSERRQGGLNDDHPNAWLGAACGSGQAVDAWLAVSRVDDVLQRVLDLLGGSKDI